MNMYVCVMFSLRCFFPRYGSLTGVGSSALIHEYEENKELDRIITIIVFFLLRSYSSNYFIKAMDRIFLGVYWRNKPS